MFDRKKALNFVKDSIHEKKDTSFREFEKIKRVHRYAKTLCHFVDDVNADVVEAAAIFYSTSNIGTKDENIKRSASIAKEYLENEGLDKSFIDSVCIAIANQEKRELNQNDYELMNIEDKVLIDAFMIDESSILKAFDIVIENGNNKTYEEQLNIIKEETEKVNSLIKNANTKKAKELLIKNYLLLKGLTHTLETEINADNI